MIVIKVKVKFRDDKEKIFTCCDNPSIGTAWITVYPYENKKSLERIMMPLEGIAEITYWYENKK